MTAFFVRSRKKRKIYLDNTYLYGDGNREIFLSEDIPIIINGGDCFIKEATIDPVSGCVRLDGHRLTDLDLTQLRSSVSLLHQEAVLFTGTIRENIHMSRGDADPFRIK